MAREKRDLTGEQFGRWTVLRRGKDRHDKHGRTLRYWNCQCLCGTQRDVSEKLLLSGDSQSCGCIRAEKLTKIDLTDQIIGGWHVLHESEPRINNNGKKERMWCCQCQCGSIKEVLQRSLLSGGSLSCGCLHNEICSGVQENLIGKTFGRWKVLAFGHMTKNSKAYWLCECSCENHTQKEVSGTSLKNGTSQSCGCLSSEIHSVVCKERRTYNTYDLSHDYGIGYTYNGTRFIFDKEDYQRILPYKWSLSSNGYLVSKDSETGCRLRLHRLIMNVTDPNQKVDHQNHDRLDNRKCNLRVTNSRMNNANSKLQINNTSGVTGVHKFKGRNKWMAYITVNYKTINLGSYDTIEEAIDARKKAEDLYFGEYSYANSIKIAQQYAIKEEKENGNRTH